MRSGASATGTEGWRYLHRPLKVETDSCAHRPTLIFFWNPSGALYPPSPKSVGEVLFELKENHPLSVLMAFIVQVRSRKLSSFDIWVLYMAFVPRSEVRA